MRGALFVVSAPSGAGKTSLVKALRTSVDSIAVSVSHTTRGRRPGEEHGRDYFFIDSFEFQRMLDAGDFLEHANVYDFCYGTAKRTVEAALHQGLDVVLEIDWQGARQIREQMENCTSIFILPPSRQTLEERLLNRRQDGPETIARRMQDAIAEMSHYREYDYLIVNADFDAALSQLRSIVLAKRAETKRQAQLLQDLIIHLLD
jgi:guanylate kinase